MSVDKKRERALTGKSVKNTLIGFILIISFFLDKACIKIINAISYPLIFKIFYIITLLGEAYVYIWIVLMLIAALMIYRRPIKSFIMAVFFAWIIQILLKLAINRPRPFEAMHISSLIATNMSSFPSGHTLMFFVLIPYIGKNFPKIKILLWTVAILVGISRIYLGVHYLSDVLWGAAIGYFIGWICMKIGEKYAWKY